MCDPVQITVQFDPHRLSPNQRLHHWARAGLVKTARLAARAGWYEAGCPMMDGPVEVALLVRRGRVLDPDNALAGFKACADQLFTMKHAGCGMLPDDSAEHVRWAPVQFETGKEWVGKEEVIVCIRPLESNDAG